jgi:hypothetical protein
VIDEAVLARATSGSGAVRPDPDADPVAHAFARGQLRRDEKDRFRLRFQGHHLSYLGDSEVGPAANIGAGTITCNYDGARKNPTVIGAGAFIGSGTELGRARPIGRGAYVAAGSVITQNVADDALASPAAGKSKNPAGPRPEGDDPGGKERPLLPIGARRTTIFSFPGGSAHVRNRRLHRPERCLSPFLIEGLKKLEYRGYDSAGVAVAGPDQIRLRRVHGKSGRSGGVAPQIPSGRGLWTRPYPLGDHGRPSETNAHPHVDCKGEIVVVHNGIIENYLELKTMLKAEGHVFQTETDTEIIAHLIEKHFQGSLEEAVRAALAVMEGAFAIGALAIRDPDKIIAAKMGPPLVVGTGRAKQSSPGYQSHPGPHPAGGLPRGRGDGRP